MIDDKPSPYELADKNDALGWDRDKHGLMIDCAVTPEQEIRTTTDSEA